MYHYVCSFAGYTLSYRWHVSRCLEFVSCTTGGVFNNVCSLKVVLGSTSGVCHDVVSLEIVFW